MDTFIEKLTYLSIMKVQMDVLIRHVLETGFIDIATVHIEHTGNFLFWRELVEAEGPRMPEMSDVVVCASYGNFFFADGSILGLLVQKSTLDRRQSTTGGVATYFARPRTRRCRGTLMPSFALRK